jgi:hypothetical protein
MASKEAYKKQFEDLYETEKKAKELYGYYIPVIKDSFLLEKFKEIHADEVKHMAIAKGLISLF